MSTQFVNAFRWRQSTIAQLLKCPRRFYLQHVEQVPMDHRGTGYAALLGSADHGGIDLILHGANEGRTPSRDQIRDRVLEAFDEALDRAHQQGETTDPDGIDAAIDKLEGERLQRLLRFANDPRIRAIRWLGIEWPFEFTRKGIEPRTGRLWRRRWRGTIDAFGVATGTVAEFGADGREPVPLFAGEHVVVDWKTGAATPLGFVERAANVQLGIYADALAIKYPTVNWRPFIGQIQDMDSPSRPRDEAGNTIPKWLPKQVNPAFAAALGLSVDEAMKSRKQPKDDSGIRIPKWEPARLNPAYERACARPKGPLFRAAPVRRELVRVTVESAIRQAEAGLFPASGALTGQCGMCPYAAVCPDYTPQPEAKEAA